MARSISLLLIVALLIAMTGCGKKEKPSEVTVNPSSSSASESSASSSSATPSPSTSSATPSESSSSPSQSTSSGSTAAASSSSKTGLKDGKYDERAEAWTNGQEEAIVVIKDGKISEVTLMRLDKEGNEVNYDIFDGKEHNGKVYPNLKDNRKKMADQMVEKQSPEVEAISGATTSSNNWKMAVQKALDMATKTSK